MIPFTPNATCDIYRVGVTPPASPAVADVVCLVRSDFQRGQEAGERGAFPWTHVMLVDVGVDIRDAYAGNLSFAEQDSIYIPDRNGTRFRVMFVERDQIGTICEHKRVFLDRALPAWPTNNL